VAAWSVDRLSRSLQDLVTMLGELHSKRVDLYLHQQGLDTTTPSGKAMFGMLGVFAKFERAMIQEGVKAGLARAKAEGKQVGRPKLAAEVEQSIRGALQADRGIISTAKGHRVRVSAVQRVKAQLVSEYS
jgi:DNA invertase Pin-like site-specific DNA recombinase